LRNRFLQEIEDEESVGVLEEIELAEEEKNEANEVETKQSGETKRAGQIPPTVNRIFAREIVWKPHPFDLAEPSCPRGGPGGLICCEVCAANYSQYLTITCKDMEEQKKRKVAKELTQLLGFMKAAKTRLGKSVRAARRQPPPAIRPSTVTAAANSGKPRAQASTDATGDTLKERAVI